VPVTFVYLTGYATADGRAHFRDDIYGLDTPGVPAPSAATDVQTTGSIAPRAIIRPARAGQAVPTAADLKPASEAGPPGRRKVEGRKVEGSKPGAILPPVRAPSREPAMLPPGLVGGRG